MNSGASSRGTRLLNLAVFLPVSLGVLAGIFWIGLQVGAMDRVPWPQHWVFDGDADDFITCFEARADIAEGPSEVAVTLFSERIDGAREILVQMGSFVGTDGTRSLELVRANPGFMLRDLHYLPEHSPLSAPMSKVDWLVAWRCGRATS